MEADVEKLKRPEVANVEHRPFLQLRPLLGSSCSLCALAGSLSHFLSPRAKELSETSSSSGGIVHRASPRRPPALCQRLNPTAAAATRGATTTIAGRTEGFNEHVRSALFSPPLASTTRMPLPSEAGAGRRTLEAACLLGRLAGERFEELDGSLIRRKASPALAFPFLHRHPFAPAIEGSSALTRRLSSPGPPPALLAFRRRMSKEESQVFEHDRGAVRALSLAEDALHRASFPPSMQTLPPAELTLGWIVSD